MFLRLLLLFTVVPLVELFLLIEIGKWIGLPATIALVLFTGALGALEVTLDAEAMAALDEIWPGPGGEAPEAYAW